MWNIKMSKIDSDGPQVSGDEIRGLQESIRDHGLLHAITVVKYDAESAGYQGPYRGRYRVVAGRKRFQACQRLGMKVVRAVVVPDDPVKLEMIELTENCHRKDLPPAERQRQMARYAELYRLMKPAEGRVRAAKERVKRLREKKGEPPARENQPEEVKAMAETFGVSERTAQKVLQRSRTFTEANLDTMRRRGLGEKEIDRVAALEPADRTDVVGLLTEGLSFEDALAEVLAAPTTKNREEMARAEFLESCPLWQDDRINRERFRDDALLYRSLMDARIKFLRDAKWSEKKTGIQVRGPYFLRAIHFLECPHPRDWIACGRCHRGMTESGECRACRGAGYLPG